MRPCPFPDMALGHQCRVGSSGKRVAASEAQALGASPSVQCCKVFIALDVVLATRALAG